MILAGRCFTAAEGVNYDLGDIDPSMPANCISATPGPGDAGGVACDGEMFPLGDNLVLDVLSDPAFPFNPRPDQDTQYIDVAAQTDDGLSPHRELAFSARIYWEGVGTGKEWGTVLSKGNPDAASAAAVVDQWDRKSRVRKTTLLRKFSLLGMFVLGLLSIIDNGAFSR